jgi:hypothetical protein
MNDYWNSVKHVTLPVELVDGRWELLYGGDTGAREGTYGELRIAVSSIEDEEVRKRLTRTVTVKVFNEGDELLVALRDRSVQQRQADWPEIDRADLPLACTRFERIRIGPKSVSTERIDPAHGGLWIRQRGVDRTELVCSSVLLPAGFDPPTASSLNHACTLLSEHHETHRISHTLNVYQHVFYQEPATNNTKPRWYPIDALRNGVIADMERSIVVDAWRKLEEQLGFRPVGKADPKAPKRKR